LLQDAKERTETKLANVWNLWQCRVSWWEVSKAGDLTKLAGYNSGSNASSDSEGDDDDEEGEGYNDNSGDGSGSASNEAPKLREMAPRLAASMPLRASAPMKKRSKNKSDKKEEENEEKEQADEKEKGKGEEKEQFNSVAAKVSLKVSWSRDSIGILLTIMAGMVPRYTLSQSDEERFGG